ncbi:putative sulfakinin receptor [Ixodes scapularis]
MAFVYSCISVTLCHGMKLDNRTGRKWEKPKRLPAPILQSGQTYEKLMSQNGVHEEYHTNPNMPQLMTFPDVELRRQKLNRRPVILRGNYKKSRASKRRVIRMLSVLVLEFFVCWMPLYVLHTWAVFDAESAYSHVSASGIAAVHLLAYVSSCCNPITYCFMHDKYRQAFRNVLGCARKRRWSSTKSHDKFASTNSVCSASRNANGSTQGSLRLTLISRLSSLKEEKPLTKEEQQ